MGSALWQCMADYSRLSNGSAMAALGLRFHIRAFESEIALPHLEFIEHFKTHIAVVIPQSHCRSFGTQIPLDSHNLRIALGDIRNIGERDVIGYFLLQGHFCGRLAVAAGNRRIYLEL